MGNDSRATDGERGWLYHPRFPANWTRRPLYDLAAWVNGLAFRKIQFSESGLPVIKIAEIKGGISGQTKFTEQTFDNSVLVRPGDLLFSWSGQPETSIDAYWWHGPQGWLNQHVFRVTPAEEVDATFFYYLLKYLNRNFVGIARNKQTTGLGHVTKGDLKNIEAAYPDLGEQRAIAHILGSLDDKIELNRRVNETLEAMARALFKSWFVDFDPVRAKMDGRWQPGESLPGLPAELYHLFPNRLVESELGQVPAGWEVRPIGEFVTLSRDSVTPSDHADEIFDHFSIPAYDEGATPKAESGSEIKSNKYVVSEGSVLVSKLNPRIPRVWLPVVGADRRPICSTEFLVVQPREANDRSWIYCLLVSSEFQTRFGSLVTGTSGSHQRVRPDAFLSLRVPVPPGAVRLRFAATAGSIQERIAQARGEARVLASLRDTLLPRLISGALRIEDAERNLARRSA